MDIPTGTFVEPVDRFWLSVVGRSSTFRALGVLVNVAIIDRGYRGEIFGVVYNFSKKPVRIASGTRICQVVPHLLVPVKFVCVESLSKSDRGTDGFGSTGS